MKHFIERALYFHDVTLPAIEQQREYRRWSEIFYNSNSPRGRAEALDPMVAAEAAAKGKGKSRLMIDNIFSIMGLGAKDFVVVAKSQQEIRGVLIPTLYDIAHADCCAVLQRRPNEYHLVKSDGITHTVRFLTYREAEDKLRGISRDTVIVTEEPWKLPMPYTCGH